MIVSFGDKETERLWQKGYIKKLPAAVQRIAMCKLQMLDAAVRKEDLSAPPGNRLESLHGDREGQCSIRVNDQWRICFRFENGSASSVSITDYH